MSGPLIDDDSPHALIGLMSGTSCDGIDAALVRITPQGPSVAVELLAFASTPYDDAFRARLLAPAKSVEDVCRLNAELGLRLGEAAAGFCRVAEEMAVAVDAIGSHGHTLLHLPDPAQGLPCTLQVGDAAYIAECTGLPVVSDFRPRDMAAGGQGAPLVPYADAILFGRTDAAVVCLNIGGIANLTVVPPDRRGVFAFDTGPGNMPLDGLVFERTNGAMRCDLDGALAAKGTVIPDLLERLLAHPYFDAPPVKSTGREAFDYALYAAPVIADFPGVSTEDLAATLTEAIARSIAGAIDRFVRPVHAIAALIVSGGGAANPCLMARLAAAVPDVPIETTDAYGIPADAKEAVAFALLAYETLRGEPNNLPGATGAREPVVMGKITLG